MRSLAAIFALLAHSPLVSSTVIGDLSYSFSGSSAVVEGKAPNSTAIDIQIPATITYYGFNYPVTEVDNSAFYEDRLNSVNLPDTVVKIGSAAFYRNGLTSVDLGNGLQVIERDAFRDNSLMSLTIPDSVSSIREYAFLDNSLASVLLGNSLVTIDDYAFWNNEIAAIAVPPSVTTIGEYAFSRNRLTSLSIPSSVSAIGEGAFRSNRISSVSFQGDYSPLFDSTIFYSNPLAEVYACETFSEWRNKSFEGIPVTLTKTACVAETPTKPEITVIEVGYEEISLNISVTYDGNRDIVRYDAVCTDGENNVSGTSTNAQVTVGSLSDGTPYSCTATVTNSEGLTSPSSDSTAPVVPKWQPQRFPVWLLYEAAK